MCPVPTKLLTQSREHANSHTSSFCLLHVHIGDVDDGGISAVGLIF